MNDLDHDRHKNLSYIVGEEKRLGDILAAGDVMALLDAAVAAGARRASITDSAGNDIWSSGEDHGVPMERYPLFLEGEAIGYVALDRAMPCQETTKIIHTAVQAILTSNFKRILTAEVHSSVVNRSYDDLIETNRRLGASERRYRELAEQLEQKVQERTVELKRAYAGLMQREKMAAIGQLAAGVAHEINNPMGFITSNLSTLKTYTSRCFGLLSHVRLIMALDFFPSTLRHDITKMWQDYKLDLIMDDTPGLIDESLAGAARIKAIVSDLRGISHIDDAVVTAVDLNNELDMLLNLLSHEIADRVHVIKDYQPLRRIMCKPALLSQAFLNIIMNSLSSRQDGLEIIISTRQSIDEICVRIQDNGPGIPDEIINRVFEPFFSTRDTGQGMGLGLTVAYDIINAHKGTIEVRGHPGTTVTVRLPEVA